MIDLFIDYWFKVSLVGYNGLFISELDLVFSSPGVVNNPSYSFSMVCGTTSSKLLNCDGFLEWTFGIESIGEVFTNFMHRCDCRVSSKRFFKSLATGERRDIGRKE